MAQDASGRGVNARYQFQDRSGEIKGQAMAQFGQSIGTAMQKVQLKREEQQKKAAAQNVFMNQFGMNEKDAKEMVSAYEKPEDAIKSLQQFMDDNQKAQVAKQQAEASRMQSEASMMRAITDRKIFKAQKEAIENSPAPKTGTADDVEGIPGAKFIWTSANAGQFVAPDGEKTSMKIGETIKVNGVSWVFDGNSIKPNPGSKEVDTLKSMIDVQTVMKGDLGDYYYSTRDPKTGNVLKGMFGLGSPVAKNEMYEQQIEMLKDEILDMTKKQKSSQSNSGVKTVNLDELK